MPDTLTGAPNTAIAGLGGADSLTAGGLPGVGFDVLIGGAGSDSYTVPTGKTSLIVENGSDGFDFFSSSALSLRSETTRLSTIDGGRHLVLQDAATQTAAIFYDWNTPANRIESLQLADGFFSVSDLQQAVASQGAPLSDRSWAGWDSLFGGNQLANLGISSNATFSSLISSYQANSAAGGLA